MDRSSLSRYFTDISPYKKLSTDDLYELFVRYHNGESFLEDLLVKKCILFATNEGLDFAYRHRYQPDDCVSAALEGLLLGIRKFNPLRSHRPLACIKLYILNTLQLYRKDFEPWWDWTLVKRIREFQGSVPLDSDTIERSSICNRENHISLDEPYPNTEDPLSDFIASSSSEDLSDDSRSLLSILSILTPKMARRIRAFYGIDCTPLSKEVLATAENTTVQAIEVSLKQARTKLQKYALSHPQYLSEVRELFR